MGNGIAVESIPQRTAKISLPILILKKLFHNLRMCVKTCRVPVSDFSIDTVRYRFYLLERTDNTLMTTEPLLTIEDAANQLSISTSTLRKLIHTPGFPALKVGKGWRIPPDLLSRWIEQQLQGRCLDGFL